MLRLAPLISLVRAPPGSVPVRWSFVVARGLVFAACLILPYCRRIVWASFAMGPDSGGDGFAAYLGYCWQDFAMLAVLCGWAWFAEARLRNPVWAFLTVAFAAFLPVAAVANVYALHIVGRPLDASWLGEINLRDAGTALPMVTAYISPDMARLAVMMLFAVPLGCLAVAWLLVTRMVLPTVGIVAAAIAAFAAQTQLDRTALGIEQKMVFINPVFAEVAMLVNPPRNLAYLNGKGARTGPVDHAGYATQPKRPATFGCCEGWNIVLVTIDTLPAKALEEALLPANAARYPNLAALVHEGDSFPKFHTNFPMSAQAMGAMTTSIYPSYAPLLTTMEQVYDRDIQTLPSMLAKNGYRSAMFMGGQLKYAGAAEMLAGQGLQTIADSDSLWCGPDDAAALSIYAHLGDDCTSAAAARWVESSTGQKFFLWAWLTNPHSPYFERRRATTGGTLGSRDQHRAALAETDAAIGVLRKAVAGAGGRTLWIVVGDHGEAFGEHGQLNHGTSVFEEQVRVPLIVSGLPARIAPPVRTRTGGMVDLAPTILDIAGIAAPAGWQGRSLFAPDHPDRAYFSSRRSGRMFGMRRGDMKYVLSSLDDGIAAYDLATDPAEARPLRLKPADERRMMEHFAAHIAYRNVMQWPKRPISAGSAP